MREDQWSPSVAAVHDRLQDTSGRARPRSARRPAAARANMPPSRLAKILPSPDHAGRPPPRADRPPRRWQTTTPSRSAFGSSASRPGTSIIGT